MLVLLLVVVIFLLVRQWLRNAALDRRLKGRYPLLDVPGLSRKDRRAYARELVRRDMEEYDEQQQERFIDILRSTPLPKER